MGSPFLRAVEKRKNDFMKRHFICQWRRENSTCSSAIHHLMVELLRAVRFQFAKRQLHEWINCGVVFLFHNNLPHPLLQNLKSVQVFFTSVGKEPNIAPETLLLLRKVKTFLSFDLSLNMCQPLFLYSESSRKISCTETFLF